MVSDRLDFDLRVLSGASGAGKTWLCERIVAEQRRRGRDTAGLLTLPRIVQGDKIGMDVQDIRTGERRPLAERTPAGNGPVTGMWHFHAEGLEWGSRLLERVGPCDFLVVDELGPLELERGEGWVAGLDVLRAGRYRRALAVVRPTLLLPFQVRMPTPARIMMVDRVNQAQRLEQISAWLGPADPGAGA